ncbi:hypothetical protein DENIS_3144 [Desulfonema ishimotonii]|uniref:DUF3592 domain-containing protein n=2 Tax=Desulfonema ishimotonii TaxID=45657 RepID=A0A401FZ14_9BACT|nr:hypothetical protein DENIS_3144 [Desulfonema ishimotonii]
MKAHKSKSYSQGRTNIRYHFAYRYTVGGKEHISGRYSFRFASGSVSEGVARFSTNDVITVYYTPDHPSVAVVKKVPAGFFRLCILRAGPFVYDHALGLTFYDDPFAILMTIRSRSVR